MVAADAELARSRRQAEQTVLTAEAEGRQRTLAGRGEAQRVMQVGLSEASVLMRKIASFGDPRLYALSVVAEQLTHSSQPLVPERVSWPAATARPAGRAACWACLLNLLVAEKSGFQPVDAGGTGRPQGDGRALDPRGGGVVRRRRIRPRREAGRGRRRRRSHRRPLTGDAG